MSHDEVHNQGEDFLRQRLDEFQFQQNAEHWSRMEQLIGSESQLQARLDQHSFAFVPKHWDKMAALLDRKKRRPVILWWSAAAAILAIVSVGVYFADNTTTTATTTTHNHSIVENNITSGEKHSQQGQQSAETSATKPSVSNVIKKSVPFSTNSISNSVATQSALQPLSIEGDNKSIVSNESLVSNPIEVRTPLAPAQDRSVETPQNYIEQLSARAESIKQNTEPSSKTPKLLLVATATKKLSWHAILGINMSFVSNPVTNPDAFETYSSQSQTSLLRDEKYGTPGFLSPGAVAGIGVNYLIGRKSSIDIDLTYRQKTNINLGQTVSGLRQVSTDTFIDGSGQTVFQARRSTDTSTTITRQWHFLELPISFVAHVTPRHHIIGGVKPAFMFASFAERQWSSKEQDALFEGIFPTNPNESPDASSDILYRKNQDGTTSNYDRFSHFDLGVMLGYRYLLSRNLSLDVRYNQGLKDLSRDKWFGKGAHFNSDLQVSLRYGF